MAKSNTQNVAVTNVEDEQTPRERFVELANGRLQKAGKALRVAGNIARQKESTDADITAARAFLQAQYAACMSALEGKPVVESLSVIS